MQSETFGPFLPIIAFNKLDEAISHIKNKDKPLAVYYFGQKSKPVQDQTSSGAVVVNDVLLHNAN